jgi:glycine oxidase
VKERQINADILVIGGGIIGLSIARELHKRGAGPIAVVDKGVCGKEASWAAAGMLGPQAEADETGPFFDLCVGSRNLYPEFAADLLDETGIDVELERSGTLHLAFSDEDAEHLLARYEWQTAAGLSVERLSAEDAIKLEPNLSERVHGALLFPNDWQVENRKLVDALRRYAEINGIEIIENTPVESLVLEDGRVTGAETARSRVSAKHTLLATGAWTSLIKLGTIQMPISVEPVRGQIIAFRPAQPLIRHVIYGPRGYLVPRMDGKILAGSTTEHTGFDAANTEEAVRSLQEMAVEIVPGLASAGVADQWAGLRPFAEDGLPVLGTIDQVNGLFIATAHYRNGILLAPVTAKLVADKLLGGVESEYFDVFGPDRFRPRGMGTNH